MGAFKRFGTTRAAGRYFKEANKYWKSAERPFKTKDESSLVHDLIRVIENCQLALAEDKDYGDAYVLLADALLLAGIADSIKIDTERSWYLITRAAAVIHTWWTLPNRDYPITKNVRQGEKLFQTILDIVNAGELTVEGDPLTRMNMYREQYAADAISPEGLQEISDVLLNRAKSEDTVYRRTKSQASSAYQWLEETLLPVHYDFLLKVVHRLAGDSPSLQIDQRPARARIQELTEDLRDTFLITDTIEEILNRFRDAYEQKDWRQMLGWLVDIRLIDDYRRNKPGYAEDLLKKLEKNWAEFFAPTINEARGIKDLDTMLLAIGYNHYLGIDEVAVKLLQEVRNEISEHELMLRMQNISENPRMMHEEATINKTREFINAE